MKRKKGLWLLAPLCGMVAGWLVGAAIVLAAGRWDYGFGLFVFMPMIVGATTSAVGQLLGIHGFLKLSLFAFGSLAIGGAEMVFFDMEGIVCVLMCVAIVAVPVGIGIAIGYGVKALITKDKKPPLPFVLLALVLPLTAWDELHHPTHPTRVTYSTSVDIKAPPNQVWDQIVSLGALPPAHDWMSKLGLACPETTQLKGHRVGAERDCQLSTGPMRERVTAWTPERELGFIALETPPPMKELNPFGDPHPDHLKKEYFQILTGEFSLEPIPGGTRLTRTTTYQHQIRAVLYSTWWCNLSADYAHHRVLDYLKAQCEHGSGIVASR